MCILKICTRVHLRLPRVCDDSGFNNVPKGTKKLHLNNLKKKHDIQSYPGICIYLIFIFIYICMLFYKQYQAIGE